ncbi:MAG: ABC transporter permease [Bryobacteraceae bacterium]
MARTWQDARFAIRALGKTSGSTVIALLSLTLGIGANTAIFSLLNALLLRPLPVPHPEKLVMLTTSIADNVNQDQSFTWPMFEALSRDHHVFSDIFCWNGGSMSNFEVGGAHFTAALAQVSANYFQAMETVPLLGRYIGSGDVAGGNGVSSAVAVISYRAWRGWYHGSANVIGEFIRVDGRPFTVIGVEPEGFSGLIIDGSTDVTVPLFAPGSSGERRPQILRFDLFGRLKDNVTFSQARTNFQVLWPHIQEATKPPGYDGERAARFFARKIKLESAANGLSFLRKRFSYALQVLLTLVGAVLSIACLNLANLSLAKSAARRHQSAVEAALGANFWDLARPPLIESLVLSSTGALLGLLLAYWLSRALLHIAWTGYVETPLSTSPDLRVLAFTAAVAVGTGVVLGILPAWHAARTDPIEALKLHARSMRGGATLLGKILLVTQVALSLVLVVGALLFARTLSHLHTADVGYRRDHLLTLALFPQAGTSRPQNSPAYYRGLAEKVRELPGVESVSYSNMGPASEFEYLEPVYRSLAQGPVQAVDETVGPGFFDAAGMHVLAGREFRWSDDDHAPPVAIISQSLSEHLFGHEDPIGRTIYAGPHAYASPLTIVGVVNSASLWKVESVRPLAIYRPLVQGSDEEPLMDVRTIVDPRSIKAAAERVIRSMGRHYSLRTMTVDERLDSYITVQQLTALLAVFFGGIALVIASAGLYGLMSFHVARRTAELGIRLALGAERRQVMMMILWEVLVLASAGCMIGIAVSLAMGRFIKGILFGVVPADPANLAAALLILTGVALLAGLLPARRAAAVDPMTALRVE